MAWYLQPDIVFAPAEQLHAITQNNLTSCLALGALIYLKCQKVFKISVKTPMHVECQKFYNGIKSCDTIEVLSELPLLYRNQIIFKNVLSHCTF